MQSNLIMLMNHKPQSFEFSHSVLSDSVIPWNVTRQASLSIGFPRQKCWNGLPAPLPGDLPNPGIEHRSPTLQADSLLLEPPRDQHI